MYGMDWSREGREVESQRTRFWQRGWHVSRNLRLVGQWRCLRLNVRYCTINEVDAVRGYLACTERSAQLASATTACPAKTAL